MSEIANATRVHYAMALHAALGALDGEARPTDVFQWLEANQRIRPQDREELDSGGPRWRKETYFSAMMLVRAGLLDRSERGVWRLTEAGQKVNLTPGLTGLLLDATAGRPGALTLERSYAAVREAALAGRFISYSDVAKANGTDWSQARRLMPRLLGRLVTIAHARGWPLLSAIVVPKDGLATGTLEGGSLEGFLAAARMVGEKVEDPETFLREQQRRVFEWAAGAPEHLGAEGRPDEPQGVVPLEEAAGEAGAVPAEEPGRQYWIGGALWGGSDDQMDRFRSEGVWQCGDDEQAGLVAQMRSGDRIAVKSSFVRKHGLPFDAAGQSVSAMRIKATGTVTGNPGDGRTVEVGWDPPFEPRDWYFYTFRKTLARLDPVDDHARRLILFIFGGVQQDYGWWLKLPYFADKYSRSAELPVPLPDEPAEEASEGGDIVEAPYTVTSVLEEGCFIGSAEVESILDLLRARKNLVLQGPPGTGKSWLAKRLGQVLIGSKGPLAQDRLRVVQFHPSMSYEDFVRGWRPDSEGRLKLRDGIFLSAVGAARADPEPFVLVIEEVNRGNPAQIFGELLTLIEDSKRHPDEAIELAYPEFHGERVHVPENLHIIGTMNVADRSLALVDLALRRRFAFVGLEPRLGPAWRQWCRDRGGLVDDLLDLIEVRLGELNARIGGDRSLGPHFRIGHSYVTPAGPVANGRQWFRGRVEAEIVPLLEEYWYDQPARVDEARAALLADL